MLEKVYGFLANKCKIEVYSKKDKTLYTKDDFAVISGTASFDSNGSATIDYPSGFTKTNCVVISFMTQGIGGTNPWSTGSTFNSGNTINGTVPKSIKLGDSNINISIRNIAISDGGSAVGSTYPDMDYKIVLMKTKEDIS